MCGFSLAQDHRKSLEKDRSLELRAEDAVDDRDELETLQGLAPAAKEEEEEKVAEEEQEDFEGE